MELNSNTGVKAESCSPSLAWLPPPLSPAEDAQMAGAAALFRCDDLQPAL